MFVTKDHKEDTIKHKKRLKGPMCKLKKRGVQMCREKVQSDIKCDQKKRLYAVISLILIISADIEQNPGPSE